MEKERETLLLVEDDPQQMQIYAEGLRKHGFVVHTASTEREAMSKLEDGLGINCLVINPYMPQMDSVNFVRDALKKNHYYLVIFQSRVYLRCYVM